MQDAQTAVRIDGGCNRTAYDSRRQSLARMMASVGSYDSALAAREDRVRYG